MKNEVSSYLENISLLVLGIFLIIFPVFLLTQTTDPLILPKQILFGGVILFQLALFGTKTITQGTIVFRRTPFDLPLGLFALFAILSSVFAVNRADSVIAVVPLLFAILAYFIIVNLVKDESSVLFLLSSAILGACLASFLAVLTFFKIYILPFDFTRIQTFTPLGNLLDQAVYLVVVLALAAYPVIRNYKKISPRIIGLGIASLIILAGLSITIYELVAPPAGGQKLLLLPFETGFQTAFAAISQDTGRTLQGFLVGSGFGTYMSDFTRFKQAAFNLNQSLWFYTFFKSSSFVLELLATVGILGISAFAFLIARIIKVIRETGVKENVVLPALLLVLAGAFLLPFSFVTQTLIFVVLGIFSAGAGTSANFFDIEFSFIAKKGDTETSERAKFLPVSFFLLTIIVGAVSAIYAIKYVSSDIFFQRSLVAASKNQGIESYNNQLSAINAFPHRDAYHRVFSQTNLSLANSLVAQQPKNSSPSAQAQQTISSLIQQSINTARNATAVSPQNTLNWQNLSSVYRSLIGFGKDAEKFAILANQQAISLDPNNPQQYINLGGIYYQLGDWENAQRQFQVAVNLKPDFANAYYNLGHALENKGDLQNALAQYQAVKTLIAGDPANSKKIDEEIGALEKKIGSTEQNSKQNVVSGQQSNSALKNQPPLGISEPSAQLPEQKPPVEIHPPPNATEAAK